MNPLTKQSLIIDIDPNTGTYSMDFVGGSLENYYKVLKDIITSMENQTLFKNGEIILDEYGNQISNEQAAKIIARAKKEFEDKKQSKNLLH